MDVNFKGNIYEYEQGLDGFLKNYELNDLSKERTPSLTSESILLTRTGSNGKFSAFYEREGKYLIGMTEKELGDFFANCDFKARERLTISKKGKSSKAVFTYFPIGELGLRVEDLDFFKQKRLFLKLYESIGEVELIRVVEEGADLREFPLMEAVQLGNIYAAQDLMEEYIKTAEKTISGSIMMW